MNGGMNPWQCPRNHHGMVWLGRVLQAHLVPIGPLDHVGLEIQPGLEHSRDEAAPASPFTPFQCPSTSQYPISMSPLAF